MDTVGTGSASQFRLYERQLGWKPPCPRRGRRPSISGTRFIGESLGGCNTPSSTGCARSARRAGLPSVRTARPRPTCTRCSPVAADGMAARQWRDMGARTQEEARSFIVSSLRRRLGLVICREFARHRIRRVPYIGVPRAVVERRMQRGQLIGGPQARVPLYVPYADFFQYQAGAGRLAVRA